MQDGILHPPSAPRAMAGRNPASPVPRMAAKRPAPAPKLWDESRLCFVVPPKFGGKAPPFYPLYAAGYAAGVSALRSAAVTLPSLREGSQPAAFLSGARTNGKSMRFLRGTHLIYMRNPRKSQQISGRTPLISYRRPCCGCNPRPFPPRRRPSTPTRRQRP